MKRGLFPQAIDEKLIFWIDSVVVAVTGKTIELVPGILFIDDHANEFIEKIRVVEEG